MSLSGQDIFNRMMLFDRELKLFPGGDDLTLAATALAVAQRDLEAMLVEAGIGTGTPPQTLTLTPNQEFSNIPSGMVRIDRIQYLDPAGTGRVVWELVPIKRTAGQVFRRGWIWGLVSNTQVGKPKAYWFDSSQLWWRPIPDAADQVRIYGFTLQADAITASSTWPYGEHVGDYVAALACRFIAVGRGDSTATIDEVVESTKLTMMKALRGFWKDMAPEYTYTFPHDT